MTYMFINPLTVGHAVVDGSITLEHHTSHTMLQWTHTHHTLSRYSGTCSRGWQCYSGTSHVTHSAVTVGHTAEEGSVTLKHHTQSITVRHTVVDGCVTLEHCTSHTVNYSMDGGVTLEYYTSQSITVWMAVLPWNITHHTVNYSVDGGVTLEYYTSHSQLQCGWRCYPGILHITQSITVWMAVLLWNITQSITVWMAVLPWNITQSITVWMAVLPWNITHHTVNYSVDGGVTLEHHTVNYSVDGGVTLEHHTVNYSVDGGITLEHCTSHTVNYSWTRSSGWRRYPVQLHVTMDTHTSHSKFTEGHTVVDSSITL